MSTDAILSVSNLEKHFYEGKLKALSGITTEIQRGEVVCVIGPSGSGKSTFLRCLNLLEQPTGGKVMFEGTDITDPTVDINLHRRRIGMVFQHFNLFPHMTVLRNMTIAPEKLLKKTHEEAEIKALSLLERVNLADRANAYPSQLSGGQKQRVGIARALASEPQVLLCDEATSALDPQTTKAILALIRDINRELGLTVVVVTHEMNVIKDICDRVAVIENGVITEMGPVLEVFTKPQRPMTKEFISVVMSNELPVAFRDQEISPTPFPGSKLLVRLTFLGESADEPVIAGLIRQYPVEVSILYGNIDHIKDTPYGRLLVGIEGTPEAVEQAMAYLRARDLEIEVIGYVR